MTAIVRRSAQSKARRSSCSLELMVALVLFVAMPAEAQTFTVLHSFTGGLDGGVPSSGLAVDVAGNLYGTTFQNGAHLSGTVYRLAPKGANWIFTPLYEFKGTTDGGWPVATPTVARDGTLYGTTLSGGLNSGNCEGNGYEGCGVVYHLRPLPAICKAASCPWTEDVIYSFTGGFYTGTDGWFPRSGVVFDQAGALYGTTSFGGTGRTNCNGGCGTVFKLTNSAGQWSENQIYSFAGGNDGEWPSTNVSFDHSGRLYGTTAEGGGSANCTDGCGTVFTLVPSSGGWIESIVHAFQGLAAGQASSAALIVTNTATVYGTADTGWTGTCGFMFEITASGGNWAFNQNATLPQSPCGNVSALVADASGNFYGTTSGGGTFSAGTVFKLTSTSGGWTYTDLHDFTCEDDGCYPSGNLLLDASGNIYGTASSGGSAGGENCYPNLGCGVVFKITP